MLSLLIFEIRFNHVFCVNHSILVQVSVSLPVLHFWQLLTMFTLRNSLSLSPHFSRGLRSGTLATQATEKLITDFALIIGRF